MLLSRAFSCASSLFLLSVASAQGEVARSAADELRFAVDAALVRRVQDGAAARAELSLDAGRSWQPLMSPDDRLHFVMAQFDPLRQPLELAGSLSAPAGTRLFLVQFHTQVLAQYQAALRARGIEVLHYMPQNALFVRAERAAIDALRVLPWVRWTGPLQNGMKLDAELRKFVTSDAPARSCNLILASKADRARAAEQVVSLGGKVVDLCDGSVMIQAELTPAQLLGLLAHDTVTYADPTTGIEFDMDNARIQGGGNYVETLAGYRGNGVRAEITESFEETHPDFTNIAGRVLVRGTNSVADHGHCTAGIVGGAGTNNAAARGMMSEATVIEGAYSSSAAIYAQATGSTNPSLQWRSMLATASWGSALTTLYTTVSQTMDDALFDSDLTRLNSQSNAGSQNSRPEAWAKNIISGGGVSHGNDSNPNNDAWSSASFGPASDGRQKPEVCAYYDNVLTSDRSSNLGYNTTAGLAGNYFTGFNGTSSATPIIAGHVGILQEMFTDGIFGNPLPQPATPANRFQNKPHMTTSKALVCGTARPYPVTQVERRKQGWGFPDLQRAYDNRNKMLVVDEYEALQLNQSRTYYVWVAPATPEFRAVMCYADPEAQANAAIHRVNSVDLKVTRAADGVFWWGNNGLTAGTAGGDQSTAGGVANDRDTLEVVRLVNPQAGLYTVTVQATAIVRDGKVETPALDVDFALVVFPMGGGYRSGPMTLDAASTGPGNLTVSCTSVPAAGWDHGYTFVSFNTGRARAFGSLFGLEPDVLTLSILGLGANPGDLLHFTNQAGAYPFTTYTVPPPIAIALSGLTFDAQVTLYNADQIVSQSNVDRVTVQ